MTRCRTAGGGRCAWGRPLGRGIARAVGTALLTALALAGRAALAQGVDEVHHLCRADFALDPAGPWSPVTLPDNWRRRGVPMPHRGWYRMTFSLDSVPTALWAVGLPAITRYHELRVNGHLVNGALPAPGTVWLTRHGASSVTLSPSLLRSGTNTIELAVEHATFGRVSCLTVGPDDRVTPPQVLRQQLVHTAPLVLNFAALLFGAFIGLFWLRVPTRRHLAGLVALAWSAVAWRNIVQLTDAVPLTGMTAAWASVLASVGAGAGLCALGLALDGGLRARWRWAVLGVTLAFAIVSAWPPTFAWWWEHRLDTYFGALSAAAAALLWTLPAAYRREYTTHRAIHQIASVTLAAMVADIFVWRGWQGVATPSLAPFVGPLAMAAAAWVLMQNVLRNLSLVQRETIDLEQRVAQRTQALAEANAAKTRFLATASHDLRQPVVTIGLLVDLLRDQADPRQHAMIDRVDEAVASMETFLAGLLDLSRFEAGTVTPRRQVVAVQAMFDAVAPEALPSARTKGLRLRLRPTALAVESDPVLLQQTLRNLVNNALRYTERGGVLVTARRRGADVLVQVWDTGIGIAPQHQARVFEELVQVANPGRDRTQGFGLGLAIVQRAAGLLGHRLSLRSQPGRGSCFGITMPLAVQAPSRPVLRAPGLRPLAGQRVVLLDDDPSVLAALGDRLAHWGAEVDRHGSLASLLKSYGAALPAPTLEDTVLITDKRLADGDGLQAVECLRASRPDLPVLVMTGNTQPDEVAELQATGLPVLHKPFRAEALLDAILAACRPLPA